MKLFLQFLSVIIYIFLNSTQCEANIFNVPGDYSSIQEALNDAEAGYTVLVAPGIYKENLIWPNKNGITLAGNGQDETIIEGNEDECVIEFEFSSWNRKIDNQTQIQNISITNGSRGVELYNSSPYLFNVTILNNSGGGGMYLYNSAPTLNTVTITKNTSYNGGGIYLYKSSPNLKNVTFSNNSAKSCGGGIFADNNSNIVFSDTERCNIFSNNALYGTDIYSDSFMTVTLDSFTVKNPTDYHAYPVENFEFNIEFGMIQQINADIYISLEGNDENTGISPDSPLKSINYALSSILIDKANPHSIFLDSGTYSPETTDIAFPIRIFSHVAIKGKGQDQTILDANSTGNIFVIENAIDITIEGLTIKNGLTNQNGGGIYLNNANPKLSNVNISNCSSNNGGGLYLANSNPILTNLTVSNNTSRNNGGVYLYESNPIFQTVIISGNSTSSDGGGLYLERSNPLFENVTISNNSASNFGGGICSKYNSTPSFSDKMNCKIISNNARLGNDIYSDKKIHLMLDSFTVKRPTSYHAFPIDNFTFYIQTGQFKQIDSDLYVSPNGSDDNWGTSFNSPLKSISYAMSIIHADDTQPHTIHLDSGTYSPDSTGTKFPIVMISNVSIKGKGVNQTILDANNISNLLVLNKCYNVIIEGISFINGYTHRSNGGEAGISSSNSNFIVANSNISSNICEGGECENAGLYLDGSNPILFNVVINNNKADGGVISMYNSNPLLINVKITGNQFGWGNSTNNSNPVFINVEITNNSSEGYEVFGFNHSEVQFVNVTMSDNLGNGNFIVVEDSYINIVNSILWNNSLKEIYINKHYSETNVITIGYSNIEGGKDDISGIDNNNVLNWLSDNINLDPQFIDPIQKNFQLKQTSPCKDAATPDFDNDGLTSEIDSNDQDPDGTRMDMGANLDRNFSFLHGNIFDLTINEPVPEVTVTSGFLQVQTDENGYYAVFLYPGENEIVFEKNGYHPIKFSQSNNSTSALRFDTEITKKGFPLNIITNELPEVENGAHYNNRIRISGGTPPYEYNITYGSLPTGLTIDNEKGTITGTPNISGSYLFSVSVTDAKQAYAEMEFVIDVVSPLVIVSDYSLKPAVKNESYHYQFEATGDRLPNNFSINDDVPSPPPGLELSQEGLLSGTPTDSGTYEFEVVVIDNSERIDRKKFQLIVVDPVSVIGQQSCYAIVGEPVSHNLSATGGLGELSWDVYSNNLSPGLKFENGLLSGSTMNPFENTIIIAVTDTIGNVAYKEIFLQIVDVLDIKTVALPTGVVDTPYNEAIQVKGGFPPYSFSFSGQLIDGLTFDSETGSISGTPTKGGLVNLELTVSDSMIPSPKQVSKTLSIRITRGFTIITSARFANSIKGQSITPIQLSTIAGTLPLSWSITDGTIVEGIELNPETGGLYGTPTQSGDFAFTVECKDTNDNQTQKEFIWHISDPLNINSSENIVVITHQNFMHMFTVNGGLRPFQWSIINGALPEGLELNSTNGVISGTAHSEHVSNITIQVMDNDYPPQIAQPPFGNASIKNYHNDLK